MSSVKLSLGSKGVVGNTMPARSPIEVAKSVLPLMLMSTNCSGALPTLLMVVLIVSTSPPLSRGNTMGLGTTCGMGPTCNEISLILNSDSSGSLEYTVSTASASPTLVGLKVTRTSRVFSPTLSLMAKRSPA